ncbi:hypothetical protein [Gracilibacillus boraciitolerans]|uniref:hypothetical protein n=1 Tax=Gracilibacillus boraciitolerans TaxID=307521 RepID=UPI000553E4A6|nr:hypothetical protein [Gracilibacillus boraciitolerans]
MLQKQQNPLDTEKLEKMGDYLGIYGFDYFYDQYREIYYSVQYKNFRSGHDKQPLIFLLKEVEGEIFVMNVSGSGNLHHSKHHLDDIDGKFTPVGVKEVMDRYAANTFAVKEYPEKS